MKATIRSGCIAVIIVILLLLSVPMSPTVLAQSDQTTVGTLTVTPTIECIGVVVSYTGDDDQNNSATLEYREAGAGSWKTAPQMYADRVRREYRGSIFWLTANTDYEVRVNFNDDGVSGSVTETTRTRNDNPPSNGNTYYVATNGSDSNPGTEAQPFGTIQKAANVVSPGDTVLIKAGTYGAGAHVTASGLADNYITFRNYVSDTPIINGGDVAFYVEARFIRIKGFKLENQTGSAIRISGEHSQASDVIVEDCVINNPDTSNGGTQGGVRIDYGAQNCLIQRNTISVDYSGTNDKDGVAWWKAGGSHVFRDNVIVGMPWDGFGGGPENDHGYMSNSDFYNNYVENAQDDGISIEGDDINVRVWGNTIMSSFMGIAICPVMIGPAYIFRNVMNPVCSRDLGNGGAMKLGDGSEGPIYLYHNTAYASDAGVDGPFATNAGLANVVSRNNIFHATWYVIEFGHDWDIAYHDFDYDNLYSADSQRFVKWGPAKYSSLSAFSSDTWQEQHGMNISATNEFVNAAANDYNIKSTSQFIDQGVILPGFNDVDSPWPYDGAAPDLGAYEYENKPPVAVNDAYSTNQDAVLNVAAPGVLINDTDTEDDTLTVTKVSDPAHGTLTLSASGAFTYTPNANYYGVDSFTYKANDGKADSSTATVSITVNASTPPPSPPSGGGGTTGATSVSLYITSSGRFVKDVTAKSLDRNVELSIPDNTIGITQTGQPLYYVSVKEKIPSPAKPQDGRIIGLVYDLGPKGATFYPPVSLTFKYDEAELPQGVAEKNLVLAMYDSDTEQWQVLESTADTENDTVMTKVSHFSLYAILAYVRPASFEVADFVLTPQEVNLGETAIINVLVTNTGDLAGSYEVSLKLDDKVVQTKEVTLNGGDTETVSFSATPETVGEHTASIGDLLSIFTVKAPKTPAYFTASGLTVTPTEVNLGESVNIGVLITNTGDLLGSYMAVLQIDDILVKTKEVALEGGDIEVIGFTITADSIGQHTLNVNGLVGAFEVREAPPVTEEASNTGPGISTFSLTPIYNTETGKLISVSISYQVNESAGMSPEAELMLKVFHDDVPLEEIPLLSLSQLQSEGNAGSLGYIPSQGWQTGIYTFRAELYDGERFVHSTEQSQFTVTPELITHVVNWRTLGAVIAAMAILIVLIAAFILYRRRDMFRAMFKNR